MRKGTRGGGDGMNIAIEMAGKAENRRGIGGQISEVMREGVMEATDGGETTEME